MVQDVDEYKDFINFMPQSKVDEKTRNEHLGRYKKNMHGRFDATTTIGFNAVSFDYLSKVKYHHPVLPVNFGVDPENLAWRVHSQAEGSNIFNSMTSEWIIKPDGRDPMNKCIVDYRIEMEFASRPYAAITTKFFDFLVDNINQQFEDRCAKLSNRTSLDDEIIFSLIEKKARDIAVSEQGNDVILDAIDPEESAAWLFDEGNRKASLK